MTTLRTAFVALALALASLSASPVASQACDRLQTGEPRELLDAIDKASTVAPVWDDYSIANHPLVLISQSRDTLQPSCAAIWRKGKPVQFVPAARGMRMSTPLYALWNVDPVGARAAGGNGAVAVALRRAPREIEEALRSTGESRAVFIPSPLYLDSIGALGRALSAMKVRIVPMLAQIAVHESFHLHSQMPSWLDQSQRYRWPAWDRQPDRKPLVALCYGPPGPVAEHHKQELETLKRAWRGLWGYPDSSARTAAIAAAREYVALRRARYRMVDSIRIPLPPGQPVGCSLAEDLMELEEGATQWIGYSTLVRAGVISPAQVGIGSPEAFYDSGMLQLWVLEFLLGPDTVREITKAIARSTSPDSEGATIFAHFQAAIQRLP